MDIRTAALLAGETGKCFKRRAWRTAAIETVTYEIMGHDRISFECYKMPWHLEPEDILADDREVVERQCDTEPKPKPKPDLLAATPMPPQPKTSKKWLAVPLAISLFSLALSIVTILL